MNNLKIGFSRLEINPHLGIAIFGYYKERFAKGILDDLMLSAIAAESGDRRLMLLSVDTCEIPMKLADGYRKDVAAACGISEDDVFIHATHTHTGPAIFHNEFFTSDDAPQDEYAAFLGKKMVDASIMAMNDLKPAKMGFIVGKAPDRVAYIRRYKMKDGSTWTCPPIEDPNIDHPIGELDQRVNVLRFDREGGDTIVFMNYGIHSDTLNIDLISPDFDGWMRKTFETAVPGTKLVFFAGAQGDVGSTHVWPEGGDMNDTEISFDNEMKSPGMCRFVGRALAGTVLQVYDKAEYVDVDSIDMIVKKVTVPSHRGTPDQLPLAREYKKLHDEGHDDLIPYTAMELTTVVAEATRICDIEDNGPDHFDLPVSGLRIGPVAFIGVPGEPFTEIGRQLKTAPGYKCILPCCLTNGAEAYFPMQDAFDEGGYEARSSYFCPGIGETLIKSGLEVLAELLPEG